MPTRTIVFCDVDDVLRWNKGAVSQETLEAIVLFQQEGGIFNMITGAPLAHVPEIPAHLIFAEGGGVEMVVEEGGLRTFETGRRAIDALREHLGIYADDGIVHTPRWGSFIVEGPQRHTSLTLLFGRPPHYPGCSTSADRERVNADIVELVQGLSLTLNIGHNTSYSFLDIFSMTKMRTIQTTMQQAGWDRVYVAGDRYPDYEAMLLPGVIPVGFSNSIAQIRALAKERGVYIDLPGPAGGTAEFFRRLNTGQV